MRKFGSMWPTLKRLLAYGSPWRKPLSVAVLLLWIAAIVVGVAVEVGLLLYALRAQTDFFFNPSQLAAGEAPEGKRIRAGGMVVGQSVQREAGSLAVQFKITDFKFLSEALLPQKKEEKLLFFILLLIYLWKK